MAYRDVVLADAPVAYYRLGETSGTAAVNLGSAAGDGTYVSFLDYWLGAPGALPNDPDTAVDFADYRLVNTNKTASQLNIDGTKPKTIECWVKRRSGDTAQRCVWSLGSPGTVNGVLALCPWSGAADGAQWLVSYWGGGNPGLFTAAPAGAWIHLVLTFEVAGGAQVVKVHVNGNPTPAYQQTLAEPIALGDGTTFRIGQLPVADYWTNGWIDEVAVYDHVLTPERIQAHYDARLLAPSGPQTVSPGGVAPTAALGTAALVPTGPQTVSATGVASTTAAGAAAVAVSSRYADYIRYTAQPKLYYRLGEPPGSPTAINLGTVAGHGTYHHDGPLGEFREPSPLAGESDTATRFGPAYVGDTVQWMNSGKYADELGVSGGAFTIELLYRRSGNNETQGVVSIGGGWPGGEGAAAAANAVALIGYKNTADPGGGFEPLKWFTLHFFATAEQTYAVGFKADIEIGTGVPTQDWAYLAIVHDPAGGAYGHGQVRVHVRRLGLGWNAAAALAHTHDLRAPLALNTDRGAPTSFRLSGIYNVHYMRDGGADEVALYDRALSPAEMEVHYRLATDAAYVPPVLMTGLASAAATGTPTLRVHQRLDPAGLAGTAATGTPAVLAAARLAPTGIAGTAATGTPGLTLYRAVSPGGWEDVDAVGIPTLGVIGPQTLGAVGALASATAFGGADVRVGVVRVNASATLAWTIRQRVGRTVGLAWTLHQRLGAQVRLSWRLLAPGTGALETFAWPYHRCRTEYPESGFRLRLGGGYTFAAAPDAPDQRVFVLSFPVMYYYLTAAGELDRGRTPELNFLLLEEFYQRHRLFKRFLYPHPVWGPRTVRFHQPLKTPDGVVGGGGALEAFEVSLIELP